MNEDYNPLNITCDIKLVELIQKWQDNLRLDRRLSEHTASSYFIDLKEFVRNLQFLWRLKQIEQDHR